MSCTIALIETAGSRVCRRYTIRTCDLRLRRAALYPAELSVPVLLSPMFSCFVKASQVSQPGFVWVDNARVFQCLAEPILSLLAPRRCPGCDLVDPSAKQTFCDACWPLLERYDMRDSCELHSVAIFRYGGPVKDAIVRMKFAHRYEIARAFEADMVNAASCFEGRVDAVVPVPLHPKRFRTRGFNQSLLLARPVARALRIPLHATALRRVRYEAPKTRLSVEERATAMDGAFVAPSRAKRLRRVLLVDDVRTTGATLAACAMALRDGGVESLCSLTLALRD